MPVLDSQFPYLSLAFLKAMNDIGQHGFEKHGANSFHAQVEKKRMIDRHKKDVIMTHVREHTLAYEVGIRHDHFDDLVHQLAAAAFNVMVEAQFAGLVQDHPRPELKTHEPPPLPVDEEFLLSRSEDGNYFLMAQRKGRFKDIGVVAKTPEDAVMLMRRLLDTISMVRPTTKELMETV